MSCVHVVPPLTSTQSKKPLGTVRIQCLRWMWCLVRWLCWQPISSSIFVVFILFVVVAAAAILLALVLFLFVAIHNFLLWTFLLEDILQNERAYKWNANTILYLFTPEKERANRINWVQVQDSILDSDRTQNSIYIPDRPLFRCELCRP